MYTPPTRAEIEAQIISAIEGRTGQNTPLLSRAFTRVLAVALSGALWLLYQLALWAMRQAFPQTADAESLAYLGDWYDMPRNPAVAAILSITVSGDDGTVVPAGTLWTGGACVYQQAADVTIAAGVATAEVSCLAAGADTTLGIGDATTLPSPLAGVTGAVVASVLVDGVDQESLDDYRARIAFRMRNQPQGGSAADYIRWASEVSGIVGGHVKLSGTDVIVYPLASLTGSARVPDAGKLAEVEDYLQDPSRRPLCATVYAQAATERTVDVQITGLDPSDSATKANIVAGIQAYLYAAYPRQFTDALAPTHIVSAAAIWGIIIAQGAVATGVTVTISGIGSGVTTYELPIGEIVKPGTISWA